VENALRGRNGRRNILGGILANILNTVWTTATYFVLPAMIIEDLNLPNALKRATYLIKNNLLLVAVSYVGVNAITGFVGFVLVAGAVIFGVAVTAGLGSLLDMAGVIAGIVLAVAVFVLVVAVVTVFTSYIGTAYHTCLFIWAREAEKAQATGQPAQAVQAPAPLAAVLGS
jgi:membrane-anchored glycerophosphoryl diester phosphodiesterase (GDPDase)